MSSTHILQCKDFRKMKVIHFFPHLLNNIKLSKNISNITVRTYARYIVGESMITLDQSTLTGRLMIYLKNQKTESNEKTENLDTKEILSCLRRASWNSTDVSSQKLINVIASLENQELVKSNKEFYRLLKVVDEECCCRHQNLNLTEILDILDAYMDLIPNKIIELKFYKMTMDYLFLLKDSLKGKDYMRFIFYIALMKKCIKSQKMLRQTLSILKDEDIKHLSCEELCIIANSTFKTSTKLSNNILNKIANYLNDNLMLLKDPAIFVTLTKALRHNRFYKEDLLATISCAMFFNKTFEFYTFQTYCHLLALYSDNLYYDEKLLQFLTMKSMEGLKFNSPNKSGSEKIRSKDIVRFLWGMSNLNCSYLGKNDIKSIIVPELIKKVQSSEMDLPQLIDAFMYLWILNYRCYELVPYILEWRTLLDQIPDKSNSKQRLNQLLTFIYHEDRPLYKKINMIPKGTTDFLLSQHLKNRPCLQDIMRSLKTIGPKMNMKFEVGYQIPYMNILGIIGYKKNIYKSVNIEVLDHFTVLKNTNGHPSGLMQMKLRILDGSEEALIVIKESEIEDLTEAEMEHFLEEELDLVC